MNEDTIRWAVCNIPPFFIPVKIGNTIRVDGFQKFLVEYLITTVNKSSKFILAPENHFGHEISPGNWTGVIGLLARQEADILASTFPALPEMFSILKFSSACDDTVFTILSGPPKRLSFGTPSLFSAIDIRTGITLILSWIIISVAYGWVSNRCNRYKSVHSSRKISITESLLTFYGLLFQKGFENLPVNTSPRIVAGAWLVSSVILSTFAGGTLSSQLAVTEKPERIETLKDILKYPNMHPYITKGIIVDNHLQLSDSKTKRDVFKQSVHHDALRNFGDFFSSWMFDEVNRGDAVIVSNIEYSLFSFVSHQCQQERRPLYISNQPFLKIPVVLAYRIGLDPVLAERLNQISTNYAASGFHHIPKKLAEAKGVPCLTVEYLRITFNTLLLRDLSQVFKILFLGSLVCTLTLIVEIVTYRITKIK